MGIPWMCGGHSCFLSSGDGYVGELLEMQQGCDGNARNSFPTKQGKDPSSRARRRKRGSPDVFGTLVLPLEWRRVCRELLELQKGCEGPFGSSRG